MKSYILELIRLVELEREAEIETMREEIKRMSGKKREKIGRAILNLEGKIIGEEFGFKLVKYGRKKEIKTEIEVGDLVLISRGKPLKSHLVGTVVEKGKRFLVVELKEVPSFALKKVRIDLYAEDITYKRQIENLKNLSFFGKKALRYALKLEKPKRSLEKDFSPFDKNLNFSQKKAVSLSLGSKDFFLIHGPFGTGKTRTLAEIARQEVERGKKVLLTAESNVAVDNLVERLSKKVEIVRIGHPSRVSPFLKETTLFSKVEKAEKYKIVKVLREEVEKLREKRDKFLKPSPSLKRGLKEKEILKLAKKKKGKRGLSAKLIQKMAQWISLQKEISSLKETIEKIEKEIAKDIIERAKIVLSTNSSSALEFLKEIKFDIAIVDEASQATIPSILIPLSKVKKFILAGDHKQLPPTILNQKAQKLRETLFEKLIEQYLGKSQMLKIQYRMNEKLMEFPNREFYGGKISSEEKVKNITLSDLELKKISFGDFWDSILDPQKPLIFLDTSKRKDKRERQRKGSLSRENYLEAILTKEITKRFLKMGIKKEWLGIITPYDDQVDLIKRLLKDEDIEVKSVDGYQGREKEIIIVSFVRSNKEKEIGFLEDLRRLNVSLTRAKRKLIAIGDKETLSSHPTYLRFLKFLEKKGLLYSLPPFYSFDDLEKFFGRKRSSTN